MRSRRLALPPRCGSMLSSRCSLKRYCGTCSAGTVLPRSGILIPCQQDPRTMVLDNRTRSVGLERDLLPNPPVHICRPLPVHKTRVR